MASVTLLELEEKMGEDFLLAIKDMRHSAERCQELIKVFLGFSRATPAKNVESSMYPSFQHSINLLRFRMVESSMRIEIENISGGNQFTGRGNSSIRAMIFYLILNEILTIYSQKNLITQDTKYSMNGTFEEGNEYVNIKFSVNIEKSSTIQSSKLISHLLNLENLDLKIKNDKLTLTQKDVRLLL